jgi:SAM-dependent methyltransferase
MQISGKASSEAGSASRLDNAVAGRIMATMVPHTDAHENQSSNSADRFDRFARYYDGDYRNYADDIDLILELAEASDGPVLELGCGTGRVMAELIAAGHNVTGVDISPQMLAVARNKLDSITHAGAYRLVQADLTSFELTGHDYALAICTSNTLMHLTTAAEQMTMLSRVCQHLAEGGRFLVDLFNPDVARLVAVNNLMELADEWEDAERRVHVTKWSVRTVDFAEQIQDTLFIYEESGADGNVRRTPCPFSLRFLWRNEAEMMLERCGFALDSVWGGFYGEPYCAESERLVLLAYKA